jgi:ligand-binding SRPBCC domain-containing protein
VEARDSRETALGRRAYARIVTTHELRRVQVLSAGLATVWAFFADPRNLALLTPPGLAFELTSEPSSPMTNGLVVTYRLCPLLGITVPWVSEISGIEAGRQFIDEQRVGPYRTWRHEHVFTPVAGGVEVRDLVHYSLPCGALGDVVNALVVAPRLRRIFDYRRRVLEQRFGRMAVAAHTSFRGAL